MQTERKDGIQVGDHVYLKGIGLTGYSGTVIRHKRGHMSWYVRLDEGQTRAGHTTLHLVKRNLRKEPV